MAGIILASFAELPPGVFIVAEFGRGGAHPFLPRQVAIGANAPGGYNGTYGYPDGIGGLIVEGSFPYKNGPPVWSESTPMGAYGMIIAPGTLKGSIKSGTCTPIPDASPYAKAGLHPVPITNTMKDCLVGCNISEITQTGVDPCHAADVHDPTNSVASCFDLGPGTVQGAGACGYNCTLLQPKLSDKGELQTCDRDDIAAGKCNIFCDTRTFPNSTR